MPTEHPNAATVTARIGEARFMAKVRISDTGLLAIGGMVSGILLSTAVLVWVATGPARRHPVATGLLTKL